MSAARPASASSSARGTSPSASIASCGHAGRHSPQRVHASSTMRTMAPSTATASAGHTRTQAIQATHESGLILKSTRQPAGALRLSEQRRARAP
ncbi:MAG: hypothetical protein AUH75_02145 [Gemmatimonadetes bacterium 13_1_40CM_4_65_7]|nr:MAG: hypothetical protein AUH75_02145 [Gemmatimonadetes bacterium 13_1_40CM_4_65_7]